jgi:LmbE family N-acetylglucosaminyl deacetylase
MVSRRKVIAGIAGLVTTSIVTNSNAANAATSLSKVAVKSKKSKKKKATKVVDAPNSLLDPKVLTSPSKQVVFYSPHPDDELLSFGPIAAEYQALGYELIYLLITAGSTTVARKLINGELLSPGNGTRFVYKGRRDPAISGYPPLTEADVGKARTIEFKSAAAEMGVHPEKLSCFDLLDNNNIPVSMCTDVIRQSINKYPDAIHWSMSTLDVHPHHRTVGECLRVLTENTSTRSAFAISRVGWDQITNQQTLQNPSIPSIFHFKPNTSRIQRVRNAALTYNAWNPVANSFAIGYASVPSQFEDLENKGDCKYALTTPSLDSVSKWIATAY